jgi:uncharacterized protein YlzI (FlbEa/FlbD family)
MKKNEFIKLTPLVENGNYYHINSMMICSIIGYENYCVIATMDSKEFIVKETLDEISKLIDNSKNITLITK